MLDFYDAILGAETLGGGGGGGSATLITKNIDANGTYSASSDNADGYSAVTVSVPNTYTASDEGKVVDNGALVAQTAYPSTITTNNTYDTTNYNSVTVNVPVPPTPAESKDVNFYDYDGTIVYSYTAAEFAQLSALPENPTHTGLTSQGWNWTLSDAQSHVSEYGYLDIGQMYITDDGSTRFYFDATSDTLNPEFSSFAYSGTTLTVDWGDNTTPDTLTVTSGSYAILEASHTYASPGLYCISITATGGTISLSETGLIGAKDTSMASELSKYYRRKVKNIFLTDTYIYGTPYFPYPNVETITIPNNFNNNFTTNGFLSYMCSLKHITFPSSVTTIPNESFRSDVSLKSASFPNNVNTNSYNLFYGCSLLERSPVTYTGSDGFRDCTYLKYAKSSNGVTQNSFYNCYNLRKIHIKNASYTSSISNYAFYNCYNLEEITIPSSITSIGNGAFYQCLSLKTIEVPSSITSIGTDCFKYCNALETITINKAEGSISGAPWGAPNATVVWTG